MLSSAFKLVQYCLLLYMLVSVTYTTHFLFSAVDSGWTSLLAWVHSGHKLSLGYASHVYSFDERLLTISASDSIPGSILAWPSTLSRSARSIPISQATLLSKAFSETLHPTKVIPYFYRASSKVDQDDITITTLVTRNRFKVLKQLVERYQGPISVTIHIPFPVEGFGSLTADHPSVNTLRELDELYHSSLYFSTYVDVHLAYSPYSRSLRDQTILSDDGEGGRQFNVWRNVARLFARTDFVMMLDVDFAVCTDWRGDVRDSLRQLGGQLENLESATDVLLEKRPNWPDTLNVTAKVEVFQRLRDGSAALVIPVFEYVNQDDGVDQRTFPQDKETLLQLILGPDPKIDSFHSSWAAGHNSTNYPRYYSIPPGRKEIYPIMQYQSAYEPYVIMARRVPWCDERFTGYGANKAACLFEMYLSGVSFFVMSEHFLIHQSHKYEEQARREERKYNRKLYTDFKEEACLRYLHRFNVSGTLNTSAAINAKEECNKVKNVHKIASELFDADL